MPATSLVGKTDVVASVSHIQTPVLQHGLELEAEEVWYEGMASMRRALLNRDL